MFKPNRLLKNKKTGFNKYNMLFFIMMNLFICLFLLGYPIKAFSNEFILDEIKNNKFIFISKNQNSKIEIILLNDHVKLNEIISSNIVTTKHVLPIEDFKTLKYPLGGMKVKLYKKDHLYEISILSP